MNIRTATFVCAALALSLTTLALPARAQHAGHDMSSMQASQPALIAAEVRAIDTRAHKITLKHGAMDGMPPMTMVYPCKADLALPSGLKQGDKISFRVEEIGGVQTVTLIQR